MESDKEIKQMMRKCRHKAEIPMAIFAIIITIFTYFLIYMFAAVVDDDGGILQEITSGLGMDPTLSRVLMGAEDYFLPVFLIYTAIKIIVEVKKLYNNSYITGIRVSPKQFPEVYEMEREMAKKLGLEREPKVFINPGSSQTKVLGVPIDTHTIVTINPGTAAYTPELARFDIARNFAHIYYGHRTLLFYLLTFVALALPIYGRAYRRCMEYSADRAAQCLLGEEEALNCLVKSCVHYLVVRKLDVDDYLEKMTKKCKFEANMYYFIHNLYEDVPLARFRIQAMLDPKKKSGRIF